MAATQKGNTFSRWRQDHCHLSTSNVAIISKTVKGKARQNAFRPARDVVEEVSQDVLSRGVPIAHYLLCSPPRLGSRMEDRLIKSYHIYWYMAALRLNYTITQSRRPTKQNFLEFQLEWGTRYQTRHS